jgi:hypothetical protein
MRGRRSRHSDGQLSLVPDDRQVLDLRSRLAETHDGGDVFEIG